MALVYHKAGNKSSRYMIFPIFILISTNLSKIHSHSNQVLLQSVNLTLPTTSNSKLIIDYADLYLSCEKY